MRYILAGVLLAVALVLFVAVVIADSKADRTAIVDRLGDDYAVLLIERGGETTEQRVVDPNEIPESGRYEGAVLYVDNDEYRYDETATARRERALSRWFDVLADRL